MTRFNVNLCSVVYAFLSHLLSVIPSLVEQWPRMGRVVCDVGCGVNGSKVLLNAYTKGLLGCAGKCII